MSQLFAERNAPRAVPDAALPAPRALRYALCALAPFWLLLIYQLGAQWTIYQQYNYGWAVPFLCAYLIWQRVQNPKFNASGSNFAPPSRRFVLSSFSVLLILYAPTRLVYEANPVWRLTSLLLAVEVIGLTLLVLLLTIGPARLAQLAFPICFFLVAVPWPYPIESFFVDLLTHLNVGTTIELLGIFGVPAVQHGNVIEIGTGMVGIDEACSGIRSFQATLMISLFLGEFYNLRARRRALLVFAGFVFAFVFNVGRTLLLTRVASLKGTIAIAAWHDPAGVTILVACFLSLWLLAIWLAKAQAASRQAPSADCLAYGPLRLQSPIPYLLAVWFLLVEGGTQAWYGLHERADLKQQSWSMQVPDGYQTKPVDKLISSEFKYDEGFETEWEDTSKAHWQLFYFRWEPARALHRRVRVQRAKMHGPATCLTHIGMTLKESLGQKIISVGKFNLAIEHYIFAVDGQPLDVFFGIYEDQLGPAALANRRLGTASRIEAALTGSRNVGQRFLEIAVHGYERPELAEAALASELGKFLKL